MRLRSVAIRSIRFPVRHDTADREKSPYLGKGGGEVSQRGFALEALFQKFVYR
jgi:hypothetical protein